MFFLAHVNREYFCFYDVSVVKFSTVVTVADCWLRWCWSRLEVCRSEAVFLEFLWLYFNTMFAVYHTFAIITHGYSGLPCRPLGCGLPVAALCRHQPPDRASYQTVDCWQPSFPGCRPTDSEQLAGRRDVSGFTVYFCVQKIFSGLHAGHQLTFSGGPSSSTAT